MNVTKDINMRFKSVRQGLSHQTVNCFYQDEFGFLWIGTQDGLNRFDGRKFDIFKPDNTNPFSINVNNIRQICGDKTGLLFIRSLQSITIYDMRLDQFTTLTEGKVSAMCYADGSLWVATDKEIYRYRNAKQKPELFFSFGSMQSKEDKDIIINSLIICHDQSIAVGTSNQGIFRLSRAGKVLQQVNIGAIFSIMEDRCGCLWIATRNRGLTRLDIDGHRTDYRHSKVAANSINHDNVRHVIQANDSLLYIGTLAGLQTLNLVSGIFTDYQYDLNIEANDVRSIVSMFYDRSGTLWLGTFYQGIQYYNIANDMYHFYRPSTAVSGHLNSRIISSITEDNQGRIWFGSEGKGLYFYDNVKKEFSTFEQEYRKEQPLKTVKSLYYEAKQHTLWVASLYQGLSRINLQTGQVDYISEEVVDTQGKQVGKAYNIVKIIEFEGRDSLLLASKDGLLILDKKELTLHPFKYCSPTPKQISQVWNMTFDKEGDLWVTTSFDLLRIELKHSLTKSYSFSQISQSNAQHNINHILCDTKGRIWLGSTGSGIYLFNKKTNRFIGYGSKQRLENSFITNLAESPMDGTIYVGTNGGLSKFNPLTTTFENYSPQSDFPLDNVNDGGLYISSNHKIYVAGLAGVVAITQEKLNKKPIDYNIFIKRILVDNRELQPLDSLNLMTATTLYQHHLRLPPQYSSVTFEITSNLLNNTSNIGWEYQLEGFDQEFIKAGDNTMITYTNLHPGHYLFRVRGDQSQTNQANIYSIPFELIVEAPIYERNWFKMVVACSLIFILWYFIRVYWIRKNLRQSLMNEKREKEYIENANQSKLRFFTNISHEFRTPLTLISSQLEMLLMHKDIAPEVYNKIIDVYKNSHRMNNLVDEVIDIRKQDQGFLNLTITKENIVAVINEVCCSFYSYAKLKKIALHFSSTLEQADLYIDKIQIEKVFYNLLSNAFKFTQPGNRITVDLCEKGDYDIVISVNNWGHGIEKEKLVHVFERFWQDHTTTTRTAIKGSGIGLSLSKEIIEQHRGSISVESEVGGVTSFIVTLHRESNAEAVTELPESKQLSNLYLIESQEISEMVPPNKEIKILLIEDNSEMLEILVRIFEPIYDVYKATNGRDGVNIACSLQPQLILSDIMMPIMSGLEMCETLKNNLETSHIPIVLLTARNTEEYMLEGLHTGADDYISKPFNIKILVARCHNIITTRKLLQQKFKLNGESIVNELPLHPIDKKLLMDATAIVESYIDNADFDVATFARELCMSRTLLFTKIKGLTGQTPNDFILSMRIQKAAEKLKNDPQALIADIALNYGFSNASYFIKCFKNAYGITPASYRRNQ